MSLRVALVDYPGCHTKWDEASARIKNYFRRYRSTDDGVLTHQKLMIVRPLLDRDGAS